VWHAWGQGWAGGGGGPRGAARGRGPGGLGPASTAIALASAASTAAGKGYQAHDAHTCSPDHTAHHRAPPPPRRPGAARAPPPACARARTRGRPTPHDLLILTTLDARPRRKGQSSRGTQPVRSEGTYASPFPFVCALVVCTKAKAATTHPFVFVFCFRPAEPATPTPAPPASRFAHGWVRALGPLSL
jgi:hypothetical protein